MGASRSYLVGEKMKKRSVTYSIYILILLLLYSSLISCQKQLPEDSSEISTQSSQLPTEESESKPLEESNLQEVSAVKEQFIVKEGSYLTQILTDLVAQGIGSSVEQLLEEISQLNAEIGYYWQQDDQNATRAFAAEGYIAPGVYEWDAGATEQEVLKMLLHSWDELISEEMKQEAQRQGYTIDQILIMASIVERESAYDVRHIVKPNVAAVVRNRIETQTALQMDVTIFYLQEALQPYRDPKEYEPYYDTYICSALPAGPIGSPSLEAVQAVLAPADTDDLFFVYDEQGNYYFAEDYEQHLKNCEVAGIL